jgi:hypothetical protein
MDIFTLLLVIQTLGATPKLKIIFKQIAQLILKMKLARVILQLFIYFELERSNKVILHLL